MRRRWAPDQRHRRRVRPASRRCRRAGRRVARGRSPPSGVGVAHPDRRRVAEAGRHRERGQVAVPVRSGIAALQRRPARRRPQQVPPRERLAGGRGQPLHHLERLVHEVHPGQLVRPRTATRRRSPPPAAARASRRADRAGPSRPAPRTCRLEQGHLTRANRIQQRHRVPVRLRRLQGVSGELGRLGRTTGVRCARGQLGEQPGPRACRAGQRSTPTDRAARSRPRPPALVTPRTTSAAAATRSGRPARSAAAPAASHRAMLARAGRR